MRSLGEGWLCFVCNMCMGSTGTVSEHLTINKSIFSASEGVKQKRSKTRNSELQLTD